MKKIEEQLRGLRFRNLSEDEAAKAWNEISSNLESAPLQAKRKNMIPLLIGALLFASAGGTVAASNSAVPGDVLFGIDRAVERVELALAGSGSAEVRLKQANERLEEVRELIARSRVQASATTTASTTATTTQKDKVNGRVAAGVGVAIEFLEDVAAELSASGNVEAAAEVNALVGELETMVNDPNVKVALKQNGDFMLKIKASNDNSTTSATSSSKIKVNTSGNKTRIEVKEEDGRFKLEIKDSGEIRIKSGINASATSSINARDNDDDDDDDDDDRKRGKNELRLDSGLKIEIR